MKITNIYTAKIWSRWSWKTRSAIIEASKKSYLLIVINEKLAFDTARQMYKSGIIKDIPRIVGMREFLENKKQISAWYNWFIIDEMSYFMDLFFGWRPSISYWTYPFDLSKIVTN